MSQEWSPSDYIGNHGEGRLMHPRMDADGMDAFLMLFELMHTGESRHENGLMISGRFIVAAIELRAAGWPVVIKSGRLRVEWHEDVPPEVLSAWRKNFGTRGLYDVKKCLSPVTMYQRTDIKSHWQGRA